MTSFAYAVGRVRALEAKLVSADEFQRLEGLPGVHGVIQELPALGYPAPEGDDYELDRWFHREQAGLNTLCDNLVEGTAYPVFFHMNHDFTNLALLARRETGIPVAEENFNELGFFSPREILDAWEGKYAPRGLSWLREVIKRVRESLDRGMAYVDWLLAESSTRILKQTASSSGLLAELAAFYADRLNIRSSFSGGRWWVAGGKIPPEAFSGILERESNVVAEEIAARINFHYPLMVPETLAAWLKGEPNPEGGISLETLLERQETAILAESRLIALGPEPVIAYYYQKTRELAELRRIILAKGF